MKPADLKKKKRAQLDKLARKHGVDPTDFARKEDLVEALIYALEDPSPFDKIRHPKKRALLSAFPECGNVTAACRAAGISRALHYHWLDKDHDYMVAFQEARETAADMLETEARRRAVDGVKDMVLYQGEPVQVDGKPLVKTTYSDVMLIVLLKANRPAKFAERYQLGTVDVEEEVRKWAIQHGFDPEVAVEKARQLAPTLS